MKVESWGGEVFWRRVENREDNVEYREKIEESFVWEIKRIRNGRIMEEEDGGVGKFERIRIK